MTVRRFKSNHSRFARFRYPQLWALLAGLLLLGTFQNCERPYNLDLANPQEENSELSIPVVINDGATLTNNPTLNVKLDKAYAQEVSIAFTPECQGEWIPLTSPMQVQWEGGDGMVDVYVKFRNFRKEETECYSHQITVDSTAPELNFTKKINSITKEKQAEFDLEVIEELSGINSLKCRLLNKSEIGVPEKEAAVPFVTCESKITLQNLADDNYKIEVVAKDLAGNASKLLSYSWIVNSLAPSLNVTTYPPRYTNVAPLTYSFSSPEDVANNTLKGYKCIVNGQANACTSPFTLSPADGNYNVTIEAESIAGNISRYENEVTLDTVKPGISLSSKPAAISNVRAPSFAFAASDAGSGIKQVRCKLNSGAEGACKNSTSTSYSNLADGQHTFQVTSVDRAGNRSNTITYGWRVDATKPTIQYAADGRPDAVTKSRSAVFKYTITDPNDGSGIDSVKCQLDERAETNCGQSQASYSGLADGTHKFKITITDKAGNQTVSNYSWQIDNVAPAVQITAKPANPTTNGTAKFDYTITEEGSGVASRTCQVDDLAPVSCGGTSYQRWVPEKGWHKFTLVVTDKAGNSKTVTAGWTKN